MDRIYCFITKAHASHFLLPSLWFLAHARPHARIHTTARTREHTNIHDILVLSNVVTSPRSLLSCTTPASAFLSASFPSCLTALRADQEGCCNVPPCLPKRYICRYGRFGAGAGATERQAQAQRGVQRDVIFRQLVGLGGSRIHRKHTEIYGESLAVLMSLCTEIYGECLAVLMYGAD